MPFYGANLEPDYDDSEEIEAEFRELDKHYGNTPSRPIVFQKNEEYYEEEE